jgi:hypothetical protein
MQAERWNISGSSQQAAHFRRAKMPGSTVGKDARRHGVAGRWAVSETQRSAGVSELRGHCDGPALRWPSRTSQRDVPTSNEGART